MRCATSWLSTTLDMVRLPFFDVTPGCSTRNFRICALAVSLPPNSDASASSISSSVAESPSGVPMSATSVTSVANT